MGYSKIAISAGHGKLVRGAAGVLDEVDEARRMLPRVAENLRALGVEVATFQDDTSKTQRENLRTIVGWHNKQDRGIDVSIHFNAFEQIDKPMGTECWYKTQQALAASVSLAMANAGTFINRGAKKTDGLYFLNNTDKPAILIEVCFVDSETDAKLYGKNFDKICSFIANSLVDNSVALLPKIDPVGVALFYAKGKCSYFGGPYDRGVSPSEGLAIYDNVGERPALFLAEQPAGTTGLARRLNTHVPYVACRWDYKETPVSMLRSEMALVRALDTGIVMKAFPADWGPNEATNRVADLSPGLMEALRIVTNDEVEVTFPYREVLTS